MPGLEWVRMSELGTRIVEFSLAAFLLVSVYWFIRDRRPLQFILRLLGLILVCLVLYWSFNFPVVAEAKSGTGEDVYPIIGLFCAMLLGMFAQYAYNHFSQPKDIRKEFDLGVFIAPVFLSPIVFIPLFETLKSDRMSSQASVMAFLVAFENGFFFKNYVDQRRPRREKTSSH